MLEAVNLSKIYKPKKGVPVKALDNINLKLPETGMVFLHGKSGSGKSTMLNVLGGLDKYNEGEIIIKGVSSKRFSQADFDSYRNTYVGFIFQEYNLLEDFTVGANIGLALELQGLKATDEKINSILEQVDMAGYGNRRPNELSGGQMQRVAIARALVKNPEIIFADEPTGALDSVTGKQVLQTLKKLSADKLVVVVSHDREFAETYADRIIELADGRVINDIERDEAALPTEENALIFSENTVEVPAGYHLTEEDRLKINAYMDSLKNGVVIKAAEKQKKFKATDVTKVNKAEKPSSPFKLIKSRLPLKNAFKIGASGLKHKKIRLVVTIILSVMAFTLFGVADTISGYDKIRIATNSLVDSGITYASITKEKKVVYNDDDFYWNDQIMLNDGDVAHITEKTGIYLTGVYTGEDGYENFDFSTNIHSRDTLYENQINIYTTTFSGFAEVSLSDLEKMGYTLIAGTLPDGSKKEIAVSAYVCETFIKAGYSESDGGILKPVRSYSDMVGKNLSIRGEDFVITGVIDTRFNLKRYEPLTDLTNRDDLFYKALRKEFEEELLNSLCAVAFTGKGFIENFMKTGLGTRITDKSVSFSISDSSEYSYSIYTERLLRLSETDISKIVWVNGEKTTLGDREIIVFSNSVGVVNSETYSPVEIEDLAVFLQNHGDITLNTYDYNYAGFTNEPGWKIVGFINGKEDYKLHGTVVCSDKFFGEVIDENAGYYSFAVGAMPQSRRGITELLEFCYDESGDIRYPLKNPVTLELSFIEMILKGISKAFLYVGIFLASFAAVLFATFIASSIAYKKQEIGILRAIGSRSNDVFRIFFSESFIIASVNFLLATIAAAFITLLINTYIREDVGILITVLNFGIRQLALMFAISMAVAFIASFLPVKKIASKKPIDAIRNR